MLWRLSMVRRPLMRIPFMGQGLNLSVLLPILTILLLAAILVVLILILRKR